MQSTMADEALFIKNIRDQLDGICAAYVDDLLQAASEAFQTESKKTEQTFQCKKRECENIQFAGSHSTKIGNGFKIHQKNRINKLQLLKHDGTFNY